MISAFTVLPKTADLAGNVIVIQRDDDLFVLLAHLRRGSVRVKSGDLVRKGDPLARVGNSGNSTMPHLHLQVQTHVNLWDPNNRSVPFAFGQDGHVPVRNDQIRTHQPSDTAETVRSPPHR